MQFNFNSPWTCIFKIAILEKISTKACMLKCGGRDSVCYFRTNIKLKKENKKCLLSTKQLQKY